MSTFFDKNIKNVITKNKKLEYIYRKMPEYLEILVVWVYNVIVIL